MGILSYYIPSNISSLFESQDFFVVSAGSVVFHSFHFIPPFIITLLVSGLYNLYAFLVWLSAYPTMMDLYILSFIFTFIFSLFLTYTIRPNYENEPKVLGFSPKKIPNGVFVLPLVAILVRTRLYVCTAYYHIMFGYMSLNFAFKSISNAPSLMTTNLPFMTPFNWGMWVIVYSNVIYSFSHTFYNFDWFLPALSQYKYLTGVPRDVIFQRIITFYLVVATPSS